MASETILITGATGKQGGAVINALIESAPDDVALRVFVRDAAADSVKALAAKGVEVAVGDMDDLPSVEQALEGVSRVFLLTRFNLMAGESPSDEARRGLNFVEALKKRDGLKQILYSTLPFGENYDEGEGKHIIQQALVDAELPLATVLPSFYLENFIDTWPAVRKDDANDSQLVWGWLPSDNPLTMPHVAIRDFGVAVAAMLCAEPEATLGKHHTMISSDLSLDDFIAQLAKKLNVQIDYAPMTKNALKNLMFPPAIVETFRYYGELWNQRQGGTMEAFRCLLPGVDTIPEAMAETRRWCQGNLQSVDSWLEDNETALAQYGEQKQLMGMAFAHAVANG